MAKTTAPGLIRPAEVATLTSRSPLIVTPVAATPPSDPLGAFLSGWLPWITLALAGALSHMRAFLRDRRPVMRRGGRLVGHSRIPGTWSEAHLPYVRRNLARRRPPGLLTLRVRYKDRIGDWFDLLLQSPEDLARLAQQSGWVLTRVVMEGGYSRGDYIGILEPR